MSDYLTLAELAEAAELPARTIRFYIARGLLDGPLKAGRDAAYTGEHLQRLKSIRKLQSEGLMLSEIGRVLDGAKPHSEPPASAWWQHVVADDVIVWTRADQSPWRLRQVRAAIADFAHTVKKFESGQPNGGKNEDRKK